MDGKESVLFEINSLFSIFNINSLVLSIMFKNNFSFFSFSSGQRKGIFALVIVIVLLQFMYWFVDFTPDKSSDLTKNKWLSLQDTISAFNESSTKTSKMYAFNPNFISDFKGYKLGMSVQEIDKLHAFREKDKYVNSAEEFQQVTGVSDSLLHAIAPFFKFPDWITHPKKANGYKKYTSVASRKLKKDINLATVEELIKVYGVGDVMANRIVAHRNTLGGFVSMEQLNEVWGLKPEVISEIETSFSITRLPSLSLIDINNASQKELSQFYYFKYSLVKQILISRSMNGDFVNIEDLSKIKGFPVDKAKIIALYLKF